MRSKMRLHFFLYKALYMEKYKFARKFCQNSVYIIVITNKYEGAKNLWNKDGGGKEENMSEGLLKIFIKDYKNVKDIKVRENYGIFAGIVGIICNLILFACKFFAGIITSSVSISADAFNNLSDAGSSIVTLAGFKMAGKPADTDHPFGHGRIEYIAGMIVSAVIIVMAIELFKDSVIKIFQPEAMEFSVVSVVILAGSIALKFWMAYFNTSLGKRIDSAAMRATAADSLSDCIATGVVLASLLITTFTGVNIDGLAGAVVAVFVFMAGIEAAKETVYPLLGQPPEESFVRQLKELVMEDEHIIGIHDLIVHNYGPGRVFVTLHAEVPYTMNLLAAHDIIDIAEHRVAGQLHCGISIHMDPVVNDDKEVEELKEMVLEVIAEIDDRLSIHDFRSTKGPYLTNLIFDLVVPHQYKYTDKEVQDMVHNAIQKKNPKCFAVVTVERSYIK